MKWSVTKSVCQLKQALFYYKYICAFVANLMTLYYDKLHQRQLLSANVILRVG